MKGEIHLDPEDVEAIAEAVYGKLRPKLHERAPLMSVSEVAQLLSCDEETVRRYADDRRIPCIRFGTGARKFPREELHEFLDRQITKAS